MKRSILAFGVGLVGWVLVASLLNRALRFGFAGYAAAEPHMTFTLGMMAARLVLGALASLAAGACIGEIARSETRVAWALGALLVASFVPVHIGLWNAFPAWYHLTFLGSLAPCVVVGSRLAKGVHRRVAAPAPSA